MAQGPFIGGAVESRTRSNYREDITEFVNAQNRAASDVRCTLSHGRTFWVFARWVGGKPSSAKWSLNLWKGKKGTDWIDRVAKGLERGNLSVIGFNVDSPPGLWVLELEGVRRPGQGDWKGMHVNADESGFKRRLVDFVNDQRPSPGGIVGALSHGKDFYVWVRRTDEPEVSTPYDLSALRPHVAWTALEHDWNVGLSEALTEDRIAMVGFNQESRPPLWCFHSQNDRFPIRPYAEQ